jgi:hypothetical protein
MTRHQIPELKGSIDRMTAPEHVISADFGASATPQVR